MLRWRRSSPVAAAAAAAARNKLLAVGIAVVLAFGQAFLLTSTKACFGREGK